MNNEEYELDCFGWEAIEEAEHQRLEEIDRTQADTVEATLDLVEMLLCKPELNTEKEMQLLGNIFDLCTQFQSAGTSEDRSTTAKELITQLREFSAVWQEKERKQEREGLPRQDCFPVKKIYKGLSKTSEGRNWAGTNITKQKALDVSGKNQAVTNVYISLLDTENGAPLQGTGSLTESACASLILAGNKFVSEKDIAQLVYGNKKPKPNQLQRVREDMSKGNIPVRIDYTEEARSRGMIKKDEEAIIEGALIPNVAYKLKTKNGKITAGYELLGLPLTFRHDKEIKQITAIPKAVYDVVFGLHVSGTERNVLIFDYLIKRIAMMKNARGEVNYKIAYESALDRVRYLFNDKNIKTEENRTIETITNCLKGLVEAKYIKSFKEYSYKGAVAGVRIETSKEEKPALPDEKNKELFAKNKELFAKGQTKTGGLNRGNAKPKKV